MNRASSRRGLVAAALVLLAVLLMADLMRQDSAVRSFFGLGSASRQQESIEQLRRRGIPIPDRTGSISPRVIFPDPPSMPA